MSESQHRNNFDLVRLFAAAQVLVGHVLFYMPGMGSTVAAKALSLFPGVPIFFFISGFLICGSWLRHPDPAAYAAARFLRIFPALWVAGLFTLVMLLLFYGGPLADNAGTALVWVLMQSSFLQSWNPAFLRGYGTGLANPVLWTIPVELAFYVALPLLCIIGRRTGRLRTVLVGAALLSFALFHGVVDGLDRSEPNQLLARKVLMQSPASFVTWLWMFLLGALAQVERVRLLRLVSGRFPLFAALALAVGGLSLLVDWPPVLHLPGNEVGLLNALTTSAASLAFAYSYPGLSAKLLGGRDLSYGLYLFHMPIANALIAVGVVGLSGAAITLVGAVACAWLSWTLIERRALAHKHKFQTYLSRYLSPREGAAA
jgi:peptidoglycan/LPS O-acetylase OafA/YrhL